MWDIKVDVASVGFGPAALASAVATVDAGASVLLAVPDRDPERLRSVVAVQQSVGGFLGSWRRSDLDGETDRYLTSLAEDLGVANSADRGLTVRTVNTVPAGGPPQPFVGSRLGQWNAQCLGSPYGMLFSAVSGWRTAQVRCDDGQTLEVMTVGSASVSEIANGFDVTNWLQRQAADRDLDVHRFTSLERIVFESGRIIGVELNTTDGLLAVGIRRGLTLCSGADDPVALPPTVVDSDVDDLQVCLVGKSASRFLRIEMLGTATQSRPMCTPSGRRLRAGLREVRALPSGAWGCGKPR